MSPIILHSTVPLALVFFEKKILDCCLEDDLLRLRDNQKLHGGLGLDVHPMALGKDGFQPHGV